MNVTLYIIINWHTHTHTYIIINYRFHHHNLCWSKQSQWLISSTRVFYNFFLYKSNVLFVFSVAIVVFWQLNAHWERSSQDYRYIYHRVNRFIFFLCCCLWKVYIFSNGQFVWFMMITFNNIKQDVLKEMMSDSNEKKNFKTTIIWL